MSNPRRARGGVRGRAGGARGSSGGGSESTSSVSSSSGSGSSSGDSLQVDIGDTAISAMWRYFHYAASDRKGTVYFTKQGAGAKQGAGFEGGQIQKGASEDSEAVPMIRLFGGPQSLLSVSSSFSLSDIYTLHSSLSTLTHLLTHSRFIYPLLPQHCPPHFLSHLYHDPTNH